MIICYLIIFNNVYNSDHTKELSILKQIIIYTKQTISWITRSYFTKKIKGWWSKVSEDKNSWFVTLSLLIITLVWEDHFHLFFFDILFFWPRLEAKFLQCQIKLMIILFHLENTLSLIQSYLLAERQNAEKI